MCPYVISPGAAVGLLSRATQQSALTRKTSSILYVATARSPGLAVVTQLAPRSHIGTSIGLRRRLPGGVQKNGSGLPHTSAAFQTAKEHPIPRTRRDLQLGPAACPQPPLPTSSWFQA